jgi:hypothetical protein
MPCEKRSIHTSDTVWQASGDSEWWRLREAALLAVGAVAEPILEVQAQQAQPALDIPALLHNVLHQDLIAPNAPPFLTGRALWMAARYCSPLTSEAVHTCQHQGLDLVMMPCNDWEYHSCAVVKRLRYLLCPLPLW